jgi:hypothetical protein
MEDQGIELMRLAVIRPADRDAQQTRIPLDEPAASSNVGEGPDFFTAVEALRAWAEADAIFDLANVMDLDKLEQLRAAVSNADSSDSPSPGDLIQDIFGASATDVINRAEWRANHSKINDSVLAHKLTPIPGRPRPLRRLADLLRAIVVVETVAERSDFPFEEASDLIKASLQLPAVFSRAQFMQQPAAAPEDRKGREKRMEEAKANATKVIEQIESYLNRLNKVDRAITEFAALDTSSFQVAFQPAALAGPWSTFRVGDLPSPATAQSDMSKESSDTVANGGVNVNLSNASGPYSGLMMHTKKLLGRWRGKLSAELGNAPMDHSEGRLMLTSAAIVHLSDETRALLEELGVDPKVESVEAILARLSEEQTKLRKEIENLLPRRSSGQLSQLGGVTIAQPSRWVPGPGSSELLKNSDGNTSESTKLAQELVQGTFPSGSPGNLRLTGSKSKYSAGKGDWTDNVKEQMTHMPAAFGAEPSVPKEARGPSLLRPMGVEELFVIREHISEYRPGEISHVENVLATEKRERVHHRRSVVEQLFEREEEREIEEEHTLQTTEREELQRETESTISENFEAKGSLENTVQNGVVKNITKGEISVSEASEEASRFAAETASEVIETARKRVASRVRTRRVSRILEELEETNTHTFDNSGAGAENVVGIYQWLDKVYRAEVWSYGLRTVYDLIVPEPAARLIAAAASSTTRGTGYMPRQPKDIEVDISCLDDQMVADLVKEYGVTEQIEPYPTKKYISVTLQTSNEGDDTSWKHYSEKQDIDIGEKFRIIQGWVAVQQFGEPPEATVGINVGQWSGSFIGNNIRGSALLDKHPRVVGGGVIVDTPIILNFDASMTGGELGPSVGGKLHASVAADDIGSLAVTITVLCEPTEEAIAEWQRKAFTAIRAAYDLRFQEWKEAQTAASFDEGDPYASLFGRNPSANRELVRQELQRAALSIMQNRPLDYDNIDERQSDGSDDPRIDFDELAQSASEIRFLNQAFEWENLTWVLYPYFWGRQSEWNTKLLWEDPDTRFVEFLKAGAARVVIPVRPDWEAAVDNYMMTRIVTFDADLDDETIGDELRLSILDEYRSQQETDEDAKHITERDFDILLPTTLLLLRRDRSLPRWERTEDGSGPWQLVEDSTT